VEDSELALLTSLPLKYTIDSLPFLGEDSKDNREDYEALPKAGSQYKLEVV